MSTRIKNPFKFLDPYTLEDKDRFYGRDREIDELYEMCFQSNVILVYGQSGTGKTSLVQCGLASRFRPTDWFEIFVRRRTNINVSLRVSLSSLAKTPLINTSSLPSMVESLYLDYYKPVFLIFDQFEELFILGSKEEQRKFIYDLSDLLKSELACTVLIVMREEYLAQLYDLEKEIPHLYDKKLRIEPMSQANAEKVITNTCSNSGIEISTTDVPKAIIDAVTEKQGLVNLVYLQVFLDKLFHLAEEQNPDKIVFNMALVKKLGKIDDVLVRFLEEQLQEYEKEVTSHGTGLTFLKAFVSDKGTKIPTSKSELPDLLPDFPPALIDKSLSFFEQKRILRPLENDQYELTHDSVAARIFQTQTHQYQLPELAEEIEVPDNPFIGFNFYTDKQMSHFFGRDQEIQALFDKILNTPKDRITFVYGQEGVGKTSLILAGLVPRISPLGQVAYHRNYKKLSEEIAGIKEGDLIPLLQTISREAAQQPGKPYVLIFDQIEALILKDLPQNQMEALFLSFQELQSKHKNLRLVFVLREKYFAKFAEYENTVPYLLDNRLRVEPVNLEQARQIILNNIELANMKMESPKILETILERIREEDGDINLSLLQLYMGRIYQELSF